AREVIQFLAEHRNLPSLYVDKEENLKDWENRAFKSNELERFPVFPTGKDRPNKLDDTEWTQEKLERETVPDELDAFMVARAWYGYAQEAVPPPGDIPGRTQPVRDRIRERLPRFMSTVIFRSSPPL